jgi:hypothetical protein
MTADGCEALAKSARTSEEVDKRVCLCAVGHKAFGVDS